MSNEIIKVFDYIGEKMGIVIDWGQEDLIPYLEDLWSRWVTYEITINSIGIVNGIILVAVIPILVFMKTKKDYEKTFNTKEDSLLFYYFHPFSCKDEPNLCTQPNTFAMIVWNIAIAGIVAGLIVFGASIHNLLELIFVPEKFILSSVK